MRFLKNLYWRLVHPQLQRLGGLSTPADKAKLIRDKGRGYRTLVETGTYLGDTVAGCLPYFQRIVTIELDPQLAERARRRFREHPNVTVVERDSATVLPEVLPDDSAVFWLDAHFCGEITAKGKLPLRTELETIVARGLPDLVLIDDAHHMGAKPTPFQQWVRDHFLRMRPPWPNTPTLEDIEQLVGPVVVEGDVIRVTLRSEPTSPAAAFVPAGRSGSNAPTS